MAKTNLLETHTVNFADMLGNGKVYRVPNFQRDYSWTLENWEDLWNDLEAISESGEQHYLGAVVLQTNDKKEFTIIDGQQRIATLSILVLAAIQALEGLAATDDEKSRNANRAQLLRDRFIGATDPASLVYSSKLFLNENDNSFYAANLLQGRPPKNERKLGDSERRLWQAYQFFLVRLQSKFAGQKDGEKMASFVSNVIGEGTLFIRIVVESELNAYVVFETLNARGLELSATDLLKNFLFSRVAESRNELDHVRGLWGKISDVVGLDTFPTFLRHFLNSKQKLVSKERLFKAVKGMVNTREEVLNLLDEMEGAAYWYRALDDPNDEFWADYPPEVRRHVRALRLFNVVQFRPLILAAKDHFNPQGVADVLRLCVVLSFRYNVIGQRNPNDLEKIFNEAAQAIRAGTITTASQVATQLQRGYPTDEEFRNDFSVREISTLKKTKLVRYILCEIEKHLGQGADIDFETSAATVEHILPENPSVEWEQFFSVEEQQRDVYRLGNYTLLERSLNMQEVANKIYQEKMTVYAGSQYAMTQRIQMSQWTPETMRARQGEMSGWATSVWRF